MKKLIIAAIMTVMAAGVFTGCASPAGNAAQNNGGNGAQGSGGNTVQDAGQGTDDSTAQNSGQNNAQNTAQNGGAASGQDIGQDGALDAALAAAGISEADAARVQVSEDFDDGRKVYEVRFDVGQTEYDYEIQAADGQVLSSDVEQNRNTLAGDDNGSGAAAQNGGNGAGAAVSRADAVATALERVPGSTENDIRIELEYDDGIQKYEGDIIYNGMEYEFEIDANTGKVISWSEERP